MENQDTTGVLIACNPEVRQCVEHVLADYKDSMHFADSFENARTYLEKGAPRLVMIELQFDGDRMFDLLNLVARDATNIPVICFRGQPSRLITTCDQAVAAVARLIANAEFWDLSLVPHGNDAETEREWLGRILSN